ncbi:hypothetical protein EV128_11687 [Rhizobium azibense]|nr:hypothetical protein EV128_11687 [Rhizobium azibense]
MFSFKKKLKVPSLQDEVFASSLHPAQSLQLFLLTVDGSKGAGSLMGFTRLRDEVARP